MTEPAATDVFDLRLDNSKTQAEILALTDGDDKFMVANDTRAIITIDDNGEKTFIVGRPVTVVNAATYATLENDYTLNIQYAGAVVVTLSNVLMAKIDRKVTISDSWRNMGLTYNITIKNEAGTVLYIIQRNGASVDFISDGTAWGGN